MEGERKVVRRWWPAEDNLRGTRLSVSVPYGCRDPGEHPRLSWEAVRFELKQETGIRVLCEPGNVFAIEQIIALIPWALSELF